MEWSLALEQNLYFMLIHLYLGLSCKFPLEKDVDVGCIVTLYNLVSSQNVCIQLPLF